LLIVQTEVHAQVTTANFYGTVTDPAGAVVPAASVTLTNEQTGATRSTLTDGAGDFVLDFVKVGVYTFRIEAPGFKKQQVSGMESDTPRGAGGLMSWAASKAVEPWV
jgi:hypothetical protein